MSRESAGGKKKPRDRDEISEILTRPSRTLGPIAAMDMFKTPSSIPQDLQLIQDIVGVPVVEPGPSLQVSRADASATDDEDSSGPDSDIPSEDEIHAELVVQDEDNKGDQCVIYCLSFVSFTL